MRVVALLVAVLPVVATIDPEDPLPGSNKLKSIKKLTMTERLAKALAQREGMNLEAKGVIYDAGDLVGANLDFWPENKCDNGQCPWSGASVLDGGVDFRDARFLAAVRALGPRLLVRIGGSQQDTVGYGYAGPCLPYYPAPPERSRGFSGGCLSKSRWTEIRSFCAAVDCRLIFGLNAMRGRGIDSEAVAPGGRWWEDRRHVGSGGCGRLPWDPADATGLVEASAEAEARDPKQRVYAYALGNEIEPQCCAPARRAYEFKQLRKILERAYGSRRLAVPLIVGADATGINVPYSKAFLAGGGVVDALAFHSYAVSGAAPEEHVEATFLQVGLRRRYDNYDALRPFHGGELWMSETGGAFNNGHPKVSGSFLNAMWYVPSAPAWNPNRFKR